MNRPRYDLAIVLFSIAMAISCFLCSVILPLITGRLGYVLLLIPASLLLGLFGFVLQNYLPVATYYNADEGGENNDSL